LVWSQLRGFPEILLIHPSSQDRIVQATTRIKADLVVV